MHAQPCIDEYFHADEVPPEIMDRLWAAGWRHFGSRFFRYNILYDEEKGELQLIQPLRIDLERFTVSKSQRRVLARNTDLSWEVIPARAEADVQEMFQTHKTRFKSNLPGHLFDFLHAGSPATLPCPCLEIRASLGGRLIAASFLALGARSSSSIYGVFDPRFSRRSLGTLTMLREIEYSREAGLLHYYPGYATRESSAYDYKKRFSALSALDWPSGEWMPLGRSG